MIKNIHSFHIPVMGTAFSIDTPLKVAKYGISSVISLVDDTLIEEIRQHYSGVHEEAYTPITKYDEDYRARRITAYLNLVDRIVKKEFEELKNSAFESGSEITKYFELLAEDSPLKRLYHIMLATHDPKTKAELENTLRNLIRPGDINVNIMTKLDRPNYAPDGKELAQEYSDALAALRGFADSTLTSCIVFSAGFNRRLYSYVENFKDFYADVTGYVRKRIIIKVTDFRSAITQGKFFAKKGIWVSEYRVESGLNCGGHAFVSDGFLMGPILEEFKNKKQELMETLHGICNEALKLKNKLPSFRPPDLRITTQGGIGTAQENRFLLRYYKIDSTGWATPFLLCPGVTNVDEETLKKLSAAGEEDVYLSPVSPLGVPFWNLRGSMSDTEKERKVAAGRPGSACPKGHLVSNTEFTPQPICTASRQYQKLKIEKLSQMNLEPQEYERRFRQVVDKACICHDLGEAVMLRYKLGKDWLKRFSAVCPGPNIAYFSKIVTLSEMVGHIYGRLNLLNSTCRPHMFIKELQLNIDYFRKDLMKVVAPTEKDIAYFLEFKKNLMEGIEYYRELLPHMAEETEEARQRFRIELMSFKKKLEELTEDYRAIFASDLTPVAA